MFNETLKLDGIASTNEPFPHFTIFDVFQETYAEEILKWFEQTDRWYLTETNFYTQYEFSLLDGDLGVEVAYLLKASTVDLVRILMKERFALTNLDLIGLTAHKLLDGHRMGIHNDSIGKKESHRLVIQLNRNWKEDRGGFLMLFNSKDPQDVACIVKPLHNSAVGFEISHKSFHAVSTVHDFERYTLVYTFNDQN
jgi:Rps23 Pro-64 3,4-dihydroxylase Tpa1-like proline 4-hydroxylase